MKRSIIVLIILGFAASSSFSQGVDPNRYSRPFVEPYSFDLIGSGPRSDGMGRAFLGVANDVTAASWNPAGLVNIEEPVMGLSYGSFSPSGKYQFGGIPLIAPARDFDHSGAFGGISSAGLAAGGRIKGHEFVGSIAMSRHSNEYQSWGFDFQIDSLVFDNTAQRFDTLEIFENQRSEKQGSISSVDFAFGTRLYRDLSVGLSINVYTGKTQRILSVNDRADDARLLDPFGQAADLRVIGTVLDSSKWTGFNFTLGGRIDGERLDAGLVLRTPFALKSNTTRSVVQIITINGIPFADGTDTTFFIDMQVIYNMPLMLGAGLAYSLDSNTILALDLEYRNFGSSSADVRDRLIINADGSTEDFTTEVTGIPWKSVFSVRGGLEKFLDTDFGRLPLRAGASIVPYPIAQSFLEATNIDEGTQVVLREKTPIEYKFSIGTGLWWSQMKFDFAYTYSMLNVNDGGGEMQNRNHFLSFGFTGVF